MEIYHGSNVIVEDPRILVNGHFKDFGFGFYCTEIEKQARRWALAKKNKHIVSVFNYKENTELKIKKFEDTTDEWIDFVVACRRGIEHDYDIVDGPMADDTIWNYVEDFVRGEISRTAFRELIKFKYPTHQIVFCTQKSLNSIEFERSYMLW